MRNYSLLFLFCISFIVNANDHGPVFNQVHLQAQAETDIPNSQLTVILAAEEEGKDATEKSPTRLINA